MSESLTLWWQARSGRERGLLRIMIGLAIFVLAWLLAVRPLADALDAAQARHAAAVVGLGEARAREAAARGGAGAAAPGQPADSLIARTAREAGFGAARIAGQGAARASIAIDAARPQALFAWLLRLEQSGFVVERLRAQANADRTLAAEALLRVRGR
jgi:general secretion pathway protein M